MRLFLGLSLPDPVSSHIGSMRGSMPSVHWNNPESYHIALCFIGEIKNYNLINDLDLTMEKIKFPSFELTIQGVNHHTSSTYETHFWASVSPTSALLQLRQKIERSLYLLDIKFKKQRFIPHVTIAKGVGLTDEQLSNWLYKYNLFKTEPFKIHQFSLFSSYPNKDHPHYVTESTYLLR